jgi:hypothetical protein
LARKAGLEAGLSLLLRRFPFLREMPMATGQGALPAGSSARRRFWLVCKWLIALAVIGFVGFEFTRQFGKLDTAALVWSPGWLFLAAVTYLAGVAASAVFWRLCLIGLGQRPTWSAAFRAYFIGHLAKYVPGKALVIALRAGMVRGPHVRGSVAVASVFYETLTSMAAGALFAAALLFLPLGDGVTLWRTLLAALPHSAFPGGEENSWLHVLFGLILLAAILVLPVLPAVFNPVVNKATARYRGDDPGPLPHLGLWMITVGFILSIVSWALFGLSVWAVIRSLHPIAFAAHEVVAATAFITVAVVIGFVLLLPGGLGVREGLLGELLRHSGLLDGGTAYLVAVLLRLTWIVAELVAAGVVYFLPAPSRLEPLEPASP